MRRVSFLPLFLSFTVTVLSQTKAPDKIYGKLFREVQEQRIFPDGKTFVDCIPKRDPSLIMEDFNKQKVSPKDLKSFIEANFLLPPAPSTNYRSDTTENIVTHITKLWQILKRDADTPVTGSSLIALPYPYIVPGGRFREIYYWDSYFTMLGLRESREYEMIENMVKNFAYLINKYGHIPNGNRTYYLSRSQPPYFAVMVDMLAELQGNQVYAIYLPALEKEYDYWMDKTAPTKHVVKMPDGSILNRYYDQSDQPRQEAYREDTKVAETSERNKSIVLRNLRSCAESGWDFSSRWLADGKTLQTIQVTNLVPVDLNSLLYNLEKILSRAYKESGDLIRERYFNQLSERRKKAINKYCWSDKEKWYVDYNLLRHEQSDEITIAGMSPLFFSLCPESRVAAIVKVIENKFLQPGGVLTTLKNTGEQWDAPNGWAPLEWIAIKGLENYQQSELARKIAGRWIALNINVYKHTGKLMEKYNVIDTHLEAGGGEYPSQDGFGWTNGVLLKLIGMYGMPKDE